MPNITLSVPEELKKKMDEFPEINWSEVARQAIRRRVELLHELDELTKDSRLTEEDAVQLGRNLRKGMAKRMGLR